MNPNKTGQDILALAGPEASVAQKRHIVNTNNKRANPALCNLWYEKLAGWLATFGKRSVTEIGTGQLVAFSCWPGWVSSMYVYIYKIYQPALLYISIHFLNSNNKRMSTSYTLVLEGLC